MHLKRSFSKIVLTVALLCAPFRAIHAQAVHYQDESGNIYFVDSIYDVPERYRKQVVTPTPTPNMTAKQWKAYNRELMKRQKVAERARLLEEKRKAKAAKLAGTGSAVAPRGGTKAQAASVLLFTSPSCAECAKLEKFLKERRVRYRRLDIVRSKEAFDAFDRLGAGSTLPVTQVGSKLIKGFNPEAILAAATSMRLVPQQEELSNEL